MARDETRTSDVKGQRPLSIAPGQLTWRLALNLSSTPFLHMKFCRSTLFEACSTLFMKPWVYIRGKQAWFWQLNPYFNSFRRIWRTYGRTYDKCLAKPLRSLLQLEILGVYMRRINYDLATVKISVFIEQRNIPFQNDISLQNHEIGSLDDPVSRS